MALTQFRRGPLTFPVEDGGAGGDAAVLLLHGFPQSPRSWDEVATRLRRSHRVLVPTMRGYAASARPAGRRAYSLDELVGDVLALADQAQLERFHLVGHDWGGAVAWALGAAHPDRLESLTVVSTPHPAAMAWALPRGQLRRSLYIGLFQLPVLPERVLLARGGRGFVRSLERAGLSTGRATEYVEALSEPGALTAALHYYRALSAAPSRGQLGPIRVRTLYVWSDGDVALGAAAARRTAHHVSGPYRFEVIEGASHWLPEQHPDRLAGLIGAHLQPARVS